MIITVDSLSRTRKGPENLFEIERVRDRERNIGYRLLKGTETLVRDRERFEIEGVRDRKSQLYVECGNTLNNARGNANLMINFVLPQSYR